MGYELARRGEDNYIQIGEDSGMKGGQNYWRSFKVMNYQSKTLLIETKTTNGKANFTRAFEVLSPDSKSPSIVDYINESGENAGQKWEH